ncbi:phosphoglycerate kinase [Acidisoma cellulosilytica]|uniref:Phosphoglycerate kinase n=1 Tax=Acidisoma cellulosilyticum TaxID=2802395 RepID=A0A964E1V6_9PROT|nr:phosphoglycerate kinase [Acidisoma cellulosilyticum]MCB8878940.1 phosphoglycerate kinase [Acidisoma cellulosilyticum]
MTFKTLDQADVAGKRVLVRADLNVPMRDGHISDMTRVERVAPTILDIADKGGRVIVLSHFERPKGKRVPEMSLAPLAEALAEVLRKPVAFADDCIGPEAEAAVAKMQDGDVLLLENTRFHKGEEENDPAFAAALGKLGDVYVNDAFSAAHRAHGSTEGVAQHLPSYAGRLMQAELDALGAALANPERPVMAIVGGSKVSTKLDLLGNLLDKVDVLVIVGAMANTFLAAKGMPVGRSLQEKDLHETARTIMAQAAKGSCEILLPVDGTVAQEFKAHAPTEVLAVDVAHDGMALDVGPASADLIIARLQEMKTLVWNGPLGAFEIQPFDASTMKVAKAVADLTQEGKLRSVAGGGDTVSALRQAGVIDELSYVSSAGGAFLEWLEGKTLPGVKALSR